MSTKQRMFETVTCDRCKSDLSDTSDLWQPEGYANDDAQGYDWLVLPHDLHLCEDCRTDLIDPWDNDA